MHTIVVNRRARLAGTTALAIVLGTALPASAGGQWGSIVDQAIAETDATSTTLKIQKAPRQYSGLKRKSKPLTVKLDLDAKSTKTTSFAASTPDAQTETKSAKGIFSGGEVQPRVTLQAQSGSERTIGTVDAFLPVYQTEESITYLDLRGVATSEEEFEGNFGIGYRQVVGTVFGEEAVLGGYGFLDIRQSPNDFTYYQGTFGVEFLTDTFEARVNGYLPDDTVNVVRPGQNVLQLSGTTVQRIVTNQVVEFALPGFDIEAGVNVDLADDVKLRATAGYFHFERNGLEASGPKGRLAIEYSDPFGMDGVQLSLGAEIRDDDLRGTDTSGFLRLSIPLSSEPTARRDLSDRAEKLGRYVFRDVDILVPEQVDTSVEVNETLTGAAADANAAPGTPSAEGEVLNLYHVADTPQGAADCSSAANACTVAIAQADPQYGAGDTLIVVDSGGSELRSNIALNAPLQNVVGADASGNAVITLPDANNTTIQLTNLGGRTTVVGTVTPFEAAALERFNIDGGHDAAILINQDLGPLGVRIEDVDIIGGSIGIDVTSAAVGAITVDAASSITGVDTTAFRLEAPQFESTFAGSIQHTGNGPAIDVRDHFGGTLAFSGPINVIGERRDELALEPVSDLSPVAAVEFRSAGSVSFSNADATYNVTGPVTFDNSFGGVAILNDSSGTFTFGDITGSTVVGSTYDEFGGSANVTVNGALSQANGFSSIIRVEDKTGGSNTFNGLVSGTLERATGIDIEENDAAIAFNGGINVSSQSGTAFRAGVNSDLAITGTSNTLSTDTGRALLLELNTINDAGVSFSSITSTGASNPNTPVIATGNRAGTVDLGDVTVAGTGAAIMTPIMPVVPMESKELAAIATVEAEPIDGVQITANSNTITASSVTVDNVTGDGVEIRSNFGTVIFDTVDIDGADESGLFIQDTSGTVTVTDGTIGDSSNSFTSLDIQGGNGTITIGADIESNGGIGTEAVSITEVTGGTVNITGTVETDGHSSSTGVFLAENTGGDVTFNGDMTLAGEGGGIIGVNNTGGTYTFNGIVDIDNRAIRPDDLDTLDTVPVGVALANIPAEAEPAGALETAPITETDMAPSGPTYNFLGGLDINVSEGIGFVAADLTDTGEPQITINTADLSSNRIVTDNGVAIEMVDVNVGTTGLNFATIDAGVSDGTPVLFSGVTGGNVRVGNVTIAGTAGEFLVKSPAPTGAAFEMKVESSGLDAMLIDTSSAIFDFTLVTIGTETTGASGDGLVLSGANGAVTIGTIDLNNNEGDGLLIEDATNNVTINGGNIGGSFVNGGSLFIDNTQDFSTITLNDVTVVADSPDFVLSAVEPSGIVDVDVIPAFPGLDFHPVIQNTSGSVITNGGSFESRGTSPALEISGNTGTVQIGSGITNSASGDSVFGTALNIDDISSGSVTINGDITRNGFGTALEIGRDAFGGVSGGINGGTVNINGAVNASNGADVAIGNIASTATVNVNGPVTITEPGFVGIDLGPIDGTVNFTGSGEAATRISGTMFSGAVDTNGTINGSVNFADLDIQVSGSGQGVVNLADTQINGTFKATDLDITVQGDPVERAAIDLSGTTGTGSIKLGDDNVAGESASIGAGIATGVLISSTTSVDFTFGDGEGVTDKGSTIAADVAISSPTAPAGGTYNFEDVLFDDGAEFDFPAGDGDENLLFVAATATGDGSGSNLDNLANEATADGTTGAVTFVLVNENGTITADDGGFFLDDGQNIDGFGNGNSFTVGAPAPEGFTGVPDTGQTFTHDGGAATLQSSPNVFQEPDFSIGGGVFVNGSNSIKNVILNADDFSISAISSGPDTFTDADISIEGVTITATGGANALEFRFDQTDSNNSITIQDSILTGNSVIEQSNNGGGAAIAPDQTEVSISNTSFQGDSEFAPALRVEMFDFANGDALSSVTVSDFSNVTVQGGGGGVAFNRVRFDSDGAGGTVTTGALQIGQDADNRVIGTGLSLTRFEGQLDASSGLVIFNDVTASFPPAAGLFIDQIGFGTVVPDPLANVNVSLDNIDTLGGPLFDIAP